MKIGRNETFVSAVPYRRMILGILLVALIGVSAACNPQPIGGGGSSTTTTPTTQVRTLPLSVAVPSDLVAKYGGSVAMRTKVETQLYTIAQSFVGFNFQLRLDVNTYTEFTTSPDWTTFQQSKVAPPPGTVLLVYSETNDLPGGWDADVPSIHHDFTEPYGGVFHQNATRGLTHEFAHVFGAIDEYGVEVDGSKNPINGMSYTVTPNYMSNPYFHPIWDTYTVGIVNKSNGVITHGGYEVVASLPLTSKLEAKTAGGQPVVGASIRMYPVGWYSSTVSPTPTYTGTTTADGTWYLPWNPFGAGTSGHPWNTTTPTFLVEVKTATQTGYAWMSIVDAGTHFFQHAGLNYPINVTVG